MCRLAQAAKLGLSPRWNGDWHRKSVRTGCFPCSKVGLGTLAPSEDSAVNMLSDAQWEALLPLVRERCSRLTEADLADARPRMDLLTAKIQNRHWVDRVTARRLVLELVEQIKDAKPAAAPAEQG